MVSRAISLFYNSGAFSKIEVSRLYLWLAHSYIGAPLDSGKALNQQQQLLRANHRHRRCSSIFENPPQFWKSDYPESNGLIHTKLSFCKKLVKNNQPNLQ